jgi:hypothetical protein
MKNLPISPVSENPTSVRLNEEDEKRLEVARRLLEKKYNFPPTFKKNKSNLLRLALYEFVSNNESQKHTA